ncbi:hypothetical protein BDW22DRAFT_1364556 [Trametopsis cervina]|nr:hypothetical protein BDW22DRAFT_1364556 [Trametopsis cervina]
MATVPEPAAEDIEAIRRLSAFSLSRNALEYAFNIPYVTDHILTHCTPGTLARLAQTCRAFHNVVQAYSASVFDINAHFRRFFDDPLGFRSLQARTGALVSGSNALQYFGRVVYEESDLDLYVKVEKVLEVGQWLIGTAGYQFEPNTRTQNQQPGISFEEAIRRVNRLHEYRPIHGLEGVYNLYKHVPGGEANGTRRKIQLITARYMPMDVILNFHSTIVMNVISFDRAYSLYPYATFERRLGLHTPTCVGLSEEKPAFVQKYRLRGWEMTNGSSELHSWHGLDQPPPHYSLPSSFRSQPRWIADRHSWVIRLPLDGVRVPAGKLGDPCYVTFWQLASLCNVNAWDQCSPAFCQISVGVEVYQHPEFAHKYAVADEKILIILSHVRSLARQLQVGLPPHPGDDTLYAQRRRRAFQSLSVDLGGERCMEDVVSARYAGP